MNSVLYICEGQIFASSPTQNKDESCTKALIVFGADINARNKYDQTPLDIALQTADDLVPLLVSVGGKRSEDIIQSSGSPSGLLKARAEIVSPSPLSKHIHSEEAKFLTSGASEARLISALHFSALIAVSLTKALAF